MKYPPFEKQFIYVPNSEKGNHSFQEPLCPTKQVLEKIGSEGLSLLKEDIKRLLQNKIELFGANLDDSGFAVKQFFYDTKNRVLLCLLYSQSDLKPKEEVSDFIKKTFVDPSLMYNDYIEVSILHDYSSFAQDEINELTCQFQAGYFEI